MVDFIISKERTNVYKEKEAGSAEHRVAQAALIERQYAAEAKAREKKRIAQEKEREARRKERKSVEKNARIEKNSDKPIIISPAQFWKKTGKHMSEFGLDAKSIDDRAKFETIVRGIVEGNQELLKGLQWRGQNEPVTAYIKGKDVVLVNSKNEFITILKKVLIMRGLRTKECAKFIDFFEEVQKAAGRCNKVFF